MQKKEDTSKESSAKPKTKRTQEAAKSQKSSSTVDSKKSPRASKGAAAQSSKAKRVVEDSTVHTTTQASAKKAKSQKKPGGKSGALMRVKPSSTSHALVKADSADKPRAMVRVKKSGAMVRVGKPSSTGSTETKPAKRTKAKAANSATENRPKSKSKAADAKGTPKANNKAAAKSTEKKASAKPTKSSAKSASTAKPEASKTASTKASKNNAKASSKASGTSKTKKSTKANGTTGASTKAASKKTSKKVATQASGKKNVAANGKASKTKKKTSGATTASKGNKRPKAKKPAAQHIAQKEQNSPFEVAKYRYEAAKDWTVRNKRSPKLIVPVAIVALYVVASVFFTFHYLPGTTINGVDASWRSAGTLASKTKEAHDNYQLQVNGDGLDFLIKGSDVDFQLDTGSYEQAAKKDLPGWMWPFAIFTPRQYQVTDGVLFSGEKVQSIVSNSVGSFNEQATTPTDAQIAYDTSRDSFQAVAEKGGTALSLDRTTSAVTQGITALRETVKLGNEELQQPNVTLGSDNLNVAVEQANQIATQELPLTIDGETIVTIGKELISSWLAIDEDCSVVVDRDLVLDWAANDLVNEVNTLGSVRNYTRPNDGKKISVVGGTYGWAVDTEKLGDQICERLTSNQMEPLEIPMASKGYTYCHGKQDWSPRYIDVDLSEQSVIMFDENSNIIMQSDCVTGDKAANNDTVTGVFYIESKMSPMKLIGLDEDGDGLPDYESDVQYWMPFYGGYGIHDAVWRNDFGESVYQYDGSHGCVNLPYYAAEILYNLVEVGDTVVVHD